MARSNNCNFILDLKLNKACELSDRQLCLNCDRFVNKKNIYSITYKTIIENFEAYHGDTTVPPLINKVHQNAILDHMYFKLKKYDNWLSHEVALCDDCFMDLTKLYILF